MNSEYARDKRSESLGFLGRFRGNCWMVRHHHALPQTPTYPLLQGLSKSGDKFGCNRREKSLGKDFLLQFY
jgi:hypothetical protein